MRMPHLQILLRQPAKLSMPYLEVMVWWSLTETMKNSKGFLSER